MCRLLLDEAMSRGLSFYAYRLPGAGVKTGYSVFPVEGFATGFVFAPFVPDGKVMSILPSLSESELLAREVTDVIYGCEFPPRSTSYNEYISGGEDIVRYLRCNREEKVVYSRVIHRHTEVILNDMFERLCEMYPHAYVFCFGSPMSGCWLGASPELLGKYADGCFRTMALAGTMAVDDISVWSEKNRFEHAVVSDFLLQELNRPGITIDKVESGEWKAGPVKHLCTSITASSDGITSAQMAGITRRLSPTPALCGLPRETALRLIAATEHHGRSYYGGFVGAFDEQQFTFWVNLRSMQVRPGECVLYVGGGYVADSDPASEWDETERKAMTLLAAGV